MAETKKPVTPRGIARDTGVLAQVRASADDAVVLIVNTDARIVEHVAGDLAPYRTCDEQATNSESLSTLWPVDVVDAVRDRVRHAVRRRCVSRVDVALQESDGQKFHEITIMAHGRNRALLICRDMTDKTSLNDEIRELAFRDVLTGLPNRAAYLKQLGLALSEAKLTGRPLSVLRVRLRGLDDINRSCGRSAGSDLVRVVAQRIAADLETDGGLRRHLPPRCSVMMARTEGNEFSFLLDGTAAGETLETFAQGVMEQFRRPVESDEKNLSLTPTTGIACYPQDSDDVESLIANAGIALHETRDKGGKSLVFFSSTVQMRSLSHIDVAHELRWALDNNQFNVHFQPCFDVTTERVTSAEALLRWFHPLRGLVPMSEILPIAQVNNLSHALGEWVMDTACREASAVQGPADWHISINLFARRSFAPDLVDRALTMAARHNLSPTRVRFEIRAQDYHRNLNASEDIVRRLNDAGFEVVLDDVGLDAINLQSLLRTQIRQLKLGRKLVERLPDSAEACQLAEAFVAMIEPLGLQLCATGVENDAQYNCLRNIGCRRMQGFFLCEPLATADFSAILNSPSARVA